MAALQSEQKQAPTGNAVSLIGLFVTALLAGGFMGATTNAVNGLVSPLYFVTILHWVNVENVWRASVAQGIFEGLTFGVLLSVVFTATVGLISGAKCSYRTGLRLLAWILLGVYACWALGGFLAMALAALSPEFYRNAFFGVPSEFGSMLAYAWVGGSIWGVEYGGMVAVVIGLVVFRAQWKYRSAAAEPSQIPAIENA